MTIEFEVLRDSPHAIADAIIERETSRVQDEYMVIGARENIRVMGQALLSYVESCERVDEWIEKISGKE